MSSVDVTKLNILIVEDNVHFRTLVRSILEALGVLNLDEVRDGIEAMEFLMGQSPDLVIVDWKMEGMDGVEFVKKTRTIEGPNRFVPIIMVTGYTETKLRDLAREAGINDFLGKPISAGSLLAHIVALMEKPKPFYETAEYFGPDRRRSDDEFTASEKRVQQMMPVRKP